MRDLLVYGGILAMFVVIVFVMRSSDAQDILRNLGRLAVRWVLWSPRNAALSALGIFAVIVVLGTVSNNATAHNNGARKPVGDPSTVAVGNASVPPSPPVTPSGQSGAVIPLSVTPTPKLTTSSSTPSPKPTSTSHGPLASFETVALKFTEHWLRHTKQPQWSNDLAPYATVSLAKLLAHTDPANVPHDVIRSAPTMSVSADGQIGVTIKLSHHTAHLVLRVQHTEWRVDSITLS